MRSQYKAHDTEMGFSDDEGAYKNCKDSYKEIWRKKKEVLLYKYTRFTC